MFVAEQSTNFARTCFILKYNIGFQYNIPLAEANGNDFLLC